MGDELPDGWKDFATPFEEWPAEQKLGAIMVADAMLHPEAVSATISAVSKSINDMVEVLGLKEAFDAR